MSKPPPAPASADERGSGWLWALFLLLFALWLFWGLPWWLARHATFEVF